MRDMFRKAALGAALMWCTFLPLQAATPSEFYSNLLRRGVAAYDAGRYDEASRQLRIAAFGLVETIESYQTAQIYLALASDKLGNVDRTRDAARRVLAAERVERRYGALSLPNAIRTAFEKIAAKVLSSAEIAGLRGSAPLPNAPAAQQPRVTTTRPAQPQQPPATTTTTTKPPVNVEQVQVETVRGTNSNDAVPPRTTTNPPATTATTVNSQPATTTTNPPSTATVTPPRTTTTNPPATTTTTTPPRTTPSQQPATTTTQPATTTTTRPATTTAQPATPRPVTLSPSELASRFAAGERALVASNLTEARRIYREILDSANLSHENAMRTAEGFYRARDFAGALRAFERAGTLRRGEEPYRYYIAVALFETGRYAEAKRELAAALPYIEITPDVARYRAKIESSIAR